MNTNQFKSKLDNIRSYALDDFAEETAIELKNNIQQLWYDAYDPEDYSRTYELLNSVDIKNTKAGRQIYINEKSISDGGRQDGNGWTEHIGVDGDRVESFADMLADNAVGNPRNGNKRLKTTGNIYTNFFEATNDWVDKNLSKRITDLVISELGKNGIRAKASHGTVANIGGNLQQGVRIKI